MFQAGRIPKPRTAIAEEHLAIWSTGRGVREVAQDKSKENVLPGQRE